MEKDVLISIRGLQYLMDEESGEQEPVEVMTTGSYYKKNGHHFPVSYTHLTLPTNSRV